MHSSFRFIFLLKFKHPVLSMYMCLSKKWNANKRIQMLVICLFFRWKNCIYKQEQQIEQQTKTKPLSQQACRVILGEWGWVGPLHGSLFLPRKWPPVSGSCIFLEISLQTAVPSCTGCHCQGNGASYTFRTLLGAWGIHWGLQAVCMLGGECQASYQLLPCSSYHLPSLLNSASFHDLISRLTQKTWHASSVGAGAE